MPAKQYVDLSGITVYDEEIKDYIDDKGYVSGSGTTGSLVKFNGAGSVTNGPSLGQSTTTFLRNDGQWAVPPGSGGIASIGDIPDVDISSVADGDALLYNSTTQTWANSPVPTPIKLTETLVTGATTVSFTNSAITSTARYDVYAENIHNLSYEDIVISGTTLTITFPAQENDVVIKLVINED